MASDSFNPEKKPKRWQFRRQYIDNVAAALQKSPVLNHTQNEHPRPAPITLAIDTSSKSTSLCVTRGVEVIKSSKANFEENRSERLWLEVERLLAEAGLSIRDVELFAVCVGPGGFTGLRVGLAAAKGFAFATGRPIIGVTSLEAAAANEAMAPAVLAMVNAYKGEVYSQLFSFDGEGEPVAGNEPLVSTFRDALERVALVEELVVAGDAAAEHADEIRKLAGEMRADESNQVFRSWSISSARRSPAEALARVARLRYLKGEAGTPEGVSACYVRPAEAELKLARGLLGSKIDRVRRQK